MNSSTKTKVAIIGSGNIGTDLMFKILKESDDLEVVAMAGIDPASDGLARAGRMGIATTHEGVEGLRQQPCYADVELVFDATSAGAHVVHDEILRSDGKMIVDLTPAAIGPFVIPVVNLDEHLEAPNINMVTCGGQATIPMVWAVKRVAERVLYGEIVATVASKSAGPGTRANIDEFTETTARAIESVGGADRGKAIIVLNPAEPPLIMRDTVHTLAQGADRGAVVESVTEVVERVQSYVPGYRLKQDVIFEDIGATAPVNVPQLGPVHGLKTSIFLEVAGAAHYLPAYAGNLDIMTSAAKAAAERWANRTKDQR